MLTWRLGVPVMVENTVWGRSFPANPALVTPEPLSMTRAAVLSSMSVNVKLYSLTGWSNTAGWPLSGAEFSRRQAGIISAAVEAQSIQPSSAIL